MTVSMRSARPSVRYSLDTGVLEEGVDRDVLNLKLSSATGEPLVDVVDGYVRTRRSSIEIKSRPGRIYIPAGFHSEYVPEWVRTRLTNEDQFFGLESMPLLEIKVVRPNLVRVNGIWCDNNTAVIATNRCISFVDRTRLHPTTLTGAGEDAVLHFTGPVETSLFGFQS
jgi:hypothetical protein